MSVYKEVVGSIGLLKQENDDFLLQENDDNIVIEGLTVALQLTAQKGKSQFTGLSIVSNRSVGGTGFLMQEDGYYFLQEDDGHLTLEGESYPLLLTATGSRTRFIVE